MTMFDSEFTNILWNGEVAGRDPDAEGDYYHITDGQADQNYWQEKLADTIGSLTTVPASEFLILYGGVVSDSGSGQVDISECVARGRDADGNRRLIHIPALTNVALPSGWNDGRPIWVIARYDFKLGTATRTHRAGTSYHYQLNDTYAGDSNGYVSTGTDDLFVDSDPVATDTILGKFTMTGTTFVDLDIRSLTYDQDMKNRLYPVGSFYVQYPDAASNIDATAFPVAQRPATMFGGTWVEQFNTEAITFYTGDEAGDQTRTAGLQADQMQIITGEMNAIYTSGGSVAGPLRGGSSVSGAFKNGAATNWLPAVDTGAGKQMHFDSSGSPNARTGTQTKGKNRLIKLWKRTVL